MKADATSAGSCAPSSRTSRISLEDSEKAAALLGDISSALTKLGETVKDQARILDRQATVLQGECAQIDMLRQSFEKVSREHAYALRFGRMWT